MNDMVRAKWAAERALRVRFHELYGEFRKCSECGAATISLFGTSCRLCGEFTRPARYTRPPNRTER